MKYIILVVISLIFLSCYEDKGNYIYKEINEIKIEGLKSEVKYRMIDSLNINPIIKSSMSDNQSYTYEWTATKLDGKLGFESKPIVIGQEKNLKYFVDLPIGKYFIALNVKDNANGLIWSNRINLTVSSSTYRGWMILSDNEGKVKLDMIEDSSNRPMISFDILSNSLLKQQYSPEKIQIMSLDFGGNWEVFLLTGNGCSRLIAEDLTWEESNDFKYLMADPKLQNIIPNVFDSSNSTGVLMIANHNLYWRTHQGTPLFGRPVNYINDELVPVAPYIGNQKGLETVWGTSNFVFFDTANKQFIKYYKNDLKCSVLDNFPKGYDLIFMQNTTYFGGTTYAILKKNKDFFILPFRSNTLTPEKMIKISIPNIENINKFAFDPLFPYMFYVDGNYIKLYSWLESSDKAIKTMLCFGEEEITMLKYNPTFSGTIENGSAYPDRFLLVGTIDNIGKGSFLIYEPLPNMENLHPYSSYKHMFSKIVDATYRER